MMTTGRESGSSARDPMRAGMQMWEAGYQSLLEGWRQTQDFWNGMARSWGEVSGAWLQQLNRGAEGSQGAEVLRELQEAAFEAAQAWMRMPMALASGAAPNDLQAAITRLTQAQGRAYQLWMESLGRLGGNPGASGAQTGSGAKRS
jgi:hypothetical protein